LPGAWDGARAAPSDELTDRQPERDHEGADDPHEEEKHAEVGVPVTLVESLRVDSGEGEEGDEGEDDMPPGQQPPHRDRSPAGYEE
jgi:hypothetical protein